MDQKELLGFKLISNFETFADFHTIVGQKLEKLKTEDEKMKMIEMIKFVYRNVLDDVLFKAVNEPLFNPCLGHFISTLINVAVADKYFKIKNEVIEIIDLIVNRLNDYYRQSKKGYNPADLIASFLPGISQFLMKMITKDEKQNKVVYVSSLKALSSLFVCVFRNYEDGLSEKLNDFPFLTPRTNEWKLKSIEKLNIIIELIERALINQSITVKESLINFTTIILFHIVDYKENHDLLPLISRNLFKITLTLLYDENESVRELSLSFTERVTIKFSSNNSFNLEELLIDDLFKLLDDFEKEMSVYNEDRILSNVKLLCGYLNCFEMTKFSFVFINQKDKLFNLLKMVYKLDLFRMSTNVLPKEQTEFKNANWFEKKFHNFDNKSLLDQLDILCGLIAKLSDQSILEDYLIECLMDLEDKKDQIFYDGNSEKKDRSTNLLVFCYLVKSFKFNQQTIQIITKLIDLLEYQLDQIDNEELFIDERFELIAFCSLSIELITNFAYSIKTKEEKNQYFRLTLYRIIACTDSPHLQLQVNARASIVNLTKILNYTSTKDLILDNIDYIISKMHIKINNYNDKENLYSVFKVIFEFTDADVCPYLEQTINNLVFALDINYSIINFERLAKVLHLVIRAFKKWYFKPEDFKFSRVLKDDKQTKMNKFSSDLIEFLKKRDKDKEELRKLEEEVRRGDIIQEADHQAFFEQQKKIREENLKNETEKENEEETLPIHIDFTKKILEKCSNFLSYNLAQARLIVLDIIVDGLDVLRLHEDSLLPTAHVVWESLVHRFKDEPVILLKCTECLLKLAISCGDFIRSRTIKQVLPQIYSFLNLNLKKSMLNTNHLSSASLSVVDKKPRESTSPIEIDLNADYKFTDSINSTNLTSSKNLAKNSSNAYFFSIEYRLQCLLLENLGKLAFDIKLIGKDLWPLIVILNQYTNNRQPIELRTAAYTSLNQLEHLDEYAVYYFKNYHFYT